MINALINQGEKCPLNRQTGAFWEQYFNLSKVMFNLEPKKRDKKDPKEGETPEGEDENGPEQNEVKESN